MATETWPSYGALLVPLRETPDSPVVRTNMESGDVKQAKQQTTVFTRRPVTYEYTKDELATWETWYRSNINNGADWFNWTDPRTGTVLEVRMVGGQYQTIGVGEVIEYWRLNTTFENKQPYT